jgi:dihydrofolate reductase
MSRLRVESFTISLDGYGAGPHQSIDNPLGVGGEALHEWAFATQTFQKMIGNAAGATGVDDDFAAQGFSNVGACIMGRNVFGPIRGEWPDNEWKGWWATTPVSRAGLRAQPSPARLDHDGRRHDLPFRHRWHPSRAEKG